MGTRGLFCRLAWKRAWGALPVGLALAIAAPSAFAAEAHEFNARLSLTGNCSVSPVDEVPDPGVCPMPPGVPGVDHPPNPFSSPRRIATDSYGNMFVASFGSAPNGEQGRVDVFNSAGFFISELEVPTGAANIAVDDEGNLYVINEKQELIRYTPSLYEPAVHKIAYGTSPTPVAGPDTGFTVDLAVNPLDQHVFVFDGPKVIEFGSAAEGNPEIEKFGEGILDNRGGPGLAIDASKNRLYVSDIHQTFPPTPPFIRVFELAAPHKLIETFDGSTTPSEKFLSNFVSLAADEATHHLFAYDGSGAEVVYELTEDGEYLATIDHELQGRWVNVGRISVDNGANSPNGALNSFGRYLFAPAFPSGVGHAFAFGPPEPCEPEITEAGFSGVSETEARITAAVNPCFLDTTYILEYTTQQRYEEEGETFNGATVAGSGEIPAGSAPVAVAANLEGLSPGTAYRFRISAENEKGGDEAEREFATYPEAEASEPCPNDALRTGRSALLPDCRAYELVTPPATNARTPSGADLANAGNLFAMRGASPAGDEASFVIQGGSLGENQGSGSFAGDPYLASRGAGGWSTSYAGPTGSEAVSLLPGGNSPDQGYSFWSADGSGSAVIEGELTNYLRYPDGHSELIGRGSSATDPFAEGKLISEGGGHVVFTSSLELEEGSPPEGTAGVYDRTADEVTHVVSLLPGQVTPAAGQNAQYQGASLDGKGVAFSIGSKLYLHFEEETYEVGENVTFAGVAEGGGRVLYLKGGNLWALDVGAPGGPIQFTGSGNVIPVNVSADGAVVYFVSPSALAVAANPNGAKPVKGGENLYRSEEGAISFVGTLTERDVEGDTSFGSPVDGLGLWISAVGPSSGTPGGFGIDPSRTTPDGNALLFESRATLDGYDPDGHAEVYRYDFAGDELDCLSCNPTLAPASGDASLRSIGQALAAEEPFRYYGLVENLRADGRRAFFQSTEALVPGDTDQLQDVYEWEAQEVGGCKRPEGCIYLISSGKSAHRNFLWAVSESGDDVFVRSPDELLKSDLEETPSIYDARVGGGFAEPEKEPECEGEGCRPGLTPPPVMPTPGMLPDSEPGSATTAKPCPKGKVRRHGKCVKKRHQKRRHHRRKAGAKKKGAGK